ncbi:inositol monophosphatase family protein [Oleispirillum naphthae]|uniref:inositol monophosphatase family protein n=1 Tax=Oleispirillum naphthae TaxID=2838853 RepID=UPI0030822C3F
MAALSPLLNVMVSASRKAARGLVRDFGEVENLQVSVKGPSDFVSAADQKAERILQQELAKARPRFGFLMEEGGEIPGEDTAHRWIIDPLDGTTNFLHGIPQFAISIALQRDNQIVAAVVHNPVSDELFYAEKGAGAFLLTPSRETRLRVSARAQMENALVGCGVPHRGRGDHPRFSGQLTRVMEHVSGVRRMGAAALDLAWIAAGRLDAYWEEGLKPWDIAAGILLVQEAGGVVIATDGSADPFAACNPLATNRKLQGPMLRLLRGA